MAFNGGKSQINLSGSEFAFLNCLLQAQQWSFANNANAPVTPDLLDANGYPTSIINSGYYTVFFIPLQSERPGNYVVKWTGNGTIALNFTTTVLPTATFTGSVTSNVLTAGAPSGGTIQKGMTLSVGGRIGDQITGSPGVAGTYNVVGGANAGSQSMSVSGGSKTGSGGSGRFVFSTTFNRFVFQISAVPVTAVVICHVDDEALLEAGQVFGVHFKQKLTEANVGVIRFLNVQNGNTTNVSTWSARKPTGYFSYGSDEWRSSVYAGTTTNTANAYRTAAFPSVHSSDGSAWTSGAPKDKDIVLVRFGASATQSGTCSIDIGTTGTAINILDAYSGALSVGTNSYPIGGTFQSLAALTYDAQLNAWIKKGGDVDQAQRGINNGWPIETMVQLCSDVGAHPHFVSPPYACTPMSDWHTQVATYIRDNGPSWMVPLFEGPNELWNTAANFNQTGYANAVATSYGWGADYNNWYGRAISTIGQAVSAVYSANRARYKVLCGVQTFTTPSSSNDRLASTKYLLQSPQAGYTASAASGWVTHVCNAQYFSASNDGTGTGTTEANAFAGKIFQASISSGVMTVSAIQASNSAAFAVGDTVFGSSMFAVGGGISAGTKITSFGSGTGGVGSYNLSDASLNIASTYLSAATDPTQATTFVDTCNSGTGQFTLSKCLTQYTAWKTWAQGFGVQKMCGYEGGYSPDLTSGGNSLMDMLRVAGKQEANLKTYCSTNYQNFVGLTDVTFTAEFPSCFQMVGNQFANSSIGVVGNVWSVLDDQYQSPNPPQWEAIRLFNVVIRTMILKT